MDQTIPPEQKNPAEQPAVLAKPKRNWTPFLLIGGVLLLLLIIFTGLVVGLKMMTASKPVPKPTPIPTENVTPTPIPTGLTQFATDSAIVKIRSDLNALVTQIDTTDIFDAQIALPNLDLNINIKSQ